MALIDAKQDLTPTSVTACEDLRRAALSAATDQELKLFKSCFSKVVSSSCSYVQKLFIGYVPVCCHTISL